MAMLPLGDSGQVDSTFPRKAITTPQPKPQRLSPHNIQPQAKGEKEAIVENKFNGIVSAPFTPALKDLNDIRTTEITEEIKSYDSTAMEEQIKITTESQKEPETEKDSMPTEEMIKKDEALLAKMLQDLEKGSNASIQPSAKKEPNKEIALSMAKQQSITEEPLPMNKIRIINPHFYGEMKSEQVVKELKNSKSSQAIYYHNTEGKPVVSYLDSAGELKHFFIKDNTTLKELKNSIEGKELKKPGFSEFSDSDIKLLEENQALVHYQNGYSFIAKKTSNGIEYLNLFSDAIANDDKVQIYSTLKDIKKKPYYFGEISSSEAEKILSQQTGTSLLVRREGDGYYLHHKGMDEKGNFTQTTTRLSFKAQSQLVESNLLLKVEAEADFLSRKADRKIIEKPRGMNLISNKLQSYAKMLNQGFHTHAVSLSKSFFSQSEGVKNKNASIPANKTSESLEETSLNQTNTAVAIHLLNDLELLGKDWGILTNADADALVEEKLKSDHDTIVWRDQAVAGIIISTLQNGEIEHFEVFSKEAWEKIVKEKNLQFNYITPPPP